MDYENNGPIVAVLPRTGGKCVMKGHVRYFDGGFQVATDPYIGNVFEFNCADHMAIPLGEAVDTAVLRVLDIDDRIMIFDGERGVTGFYKGFTDGRVQGVSFLPYNAEKPVHLRIDGVFGIIIEEAARNAP